MKVDHKSTAVNTKLILFTVSINSLSPMQVHSTYATSNRPYPSQMEGFVLWLILYQLCTAPTADIPAP